MCLFVVHGLWSFLIVGSFCWTKVGVFLKNYYDWMKITWKFWVRNFEIINCIKPFSYSNFFTFFYLECMKHSFHLHSPLLPPPPSHTTSPTSQLSSGSITVYIIASMASYDSIRWLEMLFSKWEWDSRSTLWRYSNMILYFF
jgi:hypothetical protein